MLVSTGLLTPAAAQQTTTAAGDTATPSSPSGIKLSSHPIYQEDAPPGNITPINQTYASATHSGNGTLTLPNSTQIISTTSNGPAIFSFTTLSAYAESTIRAANGETATATIFVILQFANPTAAPLGGGKGIVTAVFQTNSTDMLAPLYGMILAEVDNLGSNGQSHTTLWKWESGIVNTGANASSSTISNST